MQERIQGKKGLGHNFLAAVHGMVGQEHLEMKRHWKFRHLLMVHEKGWWKNGEKGHTGAGGLMRNS